MPTVGGLDAGVVGGAAGVEGVAGGLAGAPRVGDAAVLAVAHQRRRCQQRNPSDHQFHAQVQTI